MDEEGKTPLMRACIEGDSKAVSRMIRSGVRVDEKDGVYFDTTALMYACGMGKRECASLLLLAGANPNQKETDGVTSLMYTASGNHPACLSLLLKHRADVNATDNFGNAALHMACKFGHFECVSRLLDARADVHLADSTYQKTPLLFAAEGLHAACVPLLLRAKACIDASDRHGWTALIMSAWSGQDHTVLHLLKANADAAKADRDGETALMCAAQGDHLASVCHLLTHGGVSRSNAKGVTALMYSAREGGMQALSLLIDEGADLHATDRKGEDALMYASLEGNLECVQILLHSNADPNRVSKQGASALFLSLAHPDCVDCLLRARANVDGSPSLVHECIRAGHHASFVRIVRAGAKLEPSMLRLAAARQEKGYVSLLLEKGVPADEQALLAAVDNREVFRLLVEAGATSAHPKVAHILADQSRREAVSKVDGHVPICVFCLEEMHHGDVTYAFVPCGHRCLCGNCHASGTWTECPVCKSSCHMIMRVY